jgi:iron-sulfur cluster insertion protein
MNTANAPTPSTAVDTTAHLPAFSLSESAAKRIAELISEEFDPANTMFRVAVQGGGCSGFQYHFDLTTEPAEEDDLIIREHGAVVAVDSTSLELLKGSQLDYVEELVGAAFEMKNPNAASGCGCGNSFSVAF